MKDIIIDSIFCIIDTFIITYFFESVFNRRKTDTLTSLVPAFLILLMADLGITFLKVHLFVQLAVFIILCGAVLGVFYNGSMLKKRNTIIITILLTIIPSLLIIYIISSASNVNYAALISKNDNLRIMTNILSKLLQFAIIHAVIRIMKKKKNSISKPQILTFAAIMFLSIIAVIFTSNALLKGDINTYFCIYTTISVIIVDIVAYSLIWLYSELNRRNMDIKMQELTIQQQQRDVERIINKYYETLTLRHDIKKYVNIAIEMLNEKEYDKLGEFLRSFQENKLGSSKAYINTQNKMFNAIINQKMNEADSSDIKVECFIYDDLADFRGMEDIELCLIFLNLLENAVEAEKNVSNPMIRFTIFQKAAYTCFKIENIVDKDILSLNPELNTTKEDKHSHGVGLKSVREIIEKHDGIFNITQNDEWFTVEIMLLKSAV